MKKIFVDCSYIATHRDNNTGIQRVIRRVLESFSTLQTQYKIEVIPVLIADGELQAIPLTSLYPPQLPIVIEEKKTLRSSITNYSLDVYITGRDFISALSGRSLKVKRFLYAPRNEFGLAWLVDRLFIRPVRYCLTVGKQPAGMELEEPVQETNLFDSIQAGDVLLLLDSSWYINIWPTIRKAKSKGAKIIAVTYDLIPITHPQFCDDFLAEVFKEYFHISIESVDQYIAISHTVQQHLQDFMANQFGKAVVDRKKFDHFLLGSDFKPLKKAPAARADLEQCFNSRPTYLIVSTLEPRKNHSYVLDVFDILWAQGIEINLCFIGKVGWKVEELVERIQNHSEYETKLFHFGNINDDELAYCYQQAKMLVFPSIVEGFGLPIVESLNFGLPVLASDTAIHREVGADNIGYFDLDDANDLANKINQIEQEGMPEQYLVDKDYKWMSWLESSEMLLQKISSVD